MLSFYKKALDESKAGFTFQTLYILLIFLLKIKEKCKLGANRQKLYHENKLV